MYEGEGGHQDGGGDHLPWSDVVNLAEKIVNEDPKWLDANFVLPNYKTEDCKRPSGLCRQGYACPQYHNPKDRRRNPKKFKYGFVAVFLIERVREYLSFFVNLHLLNKALKISVL